MGPQKRHWSRKNIRRVRSGFFESVVIDDMTSFDFARYEDIIAFCGERAEAFKAKLKKLLD